MQAQKINFNVADLERYEQTHKIVDESDNLCEYLKRSTSAKPDFPNFVYHHRPAGVGFVWSHNDEGWPAPGHTAAGGIFFAPLPEKILVAKVPVYVNTEGEYRLAASRNDAPPYQLIGYATITLADVVPAKPFGPHQFLTTEVEHTEPQPDCWIPVMDNWEREESKDLDRLKKIWKNRADTPIGFLPVYLSSMVKNEEYAGGK